MQRRSDVHILYHATFTKVHVHIEPENFLQKNQDRYTNQTSQNKSGVDNSVFDKQLPTPFLQGYVVRGDVSNYPQLTHLAT